MNATLGIVGWIPAKSAELNTMQFWTLQEDILLKFLTVILSHK